MWYIRSEYSRETIKREQPLFAVDLAILNDERYAQAWANKAAVHMKNAEIANEHLKAE
jgi:hypothetical protein